MTPIHLVVVAVTPTGTFLRCRLCGRLGAVEPDQALDVGGAHQRQHGLQVGEVA